MPPLTIENASALVSGFVPSKEKDDMRAPQPGAQPTTVKVTVLRSFYFSGKVIPAKAEVELPRVFALEMAAANKVAIIKEPQAPAPAAAVEAKPASAKPAEGKKER